MAAAPIHRIGRRGGALLIFGFIDLVVGYSLISPTAQAQGRANPSYEALFAIAPPVTWGILWLLAGVSCWVSAFLKTDQLGFTCAIGIKVAWALGFVGGWLAYDAPRAWLGAVTWLVFAALVWLISGWAEPIRLPELPRLRRGDDR